MSSHAPTILPAGRKPRRLVLVLDQIRSALNVGSIFRTADAFRVQELVLCGYTPTPPNRELQKTALGAELSVPWRRAATAAAALQDLQAQGYTMLAVEQTASSSLLAHYPVDAGAAYALVLGHEVHGVSAEALACCQAALEIPQQGVKQSLNVAVAAGIACYSFSLQLP